MTHKARSGIDEECYCFSRAFVNLLYHTGQKIDDFDSNWAFSDCNSSLNSQMKPYEIMHKAWSGIEDVPYCYPRPVLASGYCHRLCLCVCVYQSLACPHDNSSPVQARITKFGPEKQNTLVKIPIAFGSGWPWPSRSNLTSNSKLTPFWACPTHYASPIQVRISKFGPQMHFSVVKIPVNSELDWSWTLHMENAPQMWNGNSNAVVKQNYHIDCFTVWLFHSTTMLCHILI